MEELVGKFGDVLNWARDDLAGKLLSGKVPVAAWHEKHAEHLALTLLLALVVLAAVHAVAGR